MPTSEVVAVPLAISLAQQGIPGVPVGTTMVTPLVIPKGTPLGTPGTPVVLVKAPVRCGGR